jgi:SAM-dependent methyltransferase
LTAASAPEPLSPAEANRQFERQASWTRAARGQLYRRANLLAASAVLDVGCGTGAITREVAPRCRGAVFGVDLNLGYLSLARARGGGPAYVQGDANSLPFPSATFDQVHCHFFLLWVRQPELALREMTRVCRPGGHILICAEPDYGGRLDYPDGLATGRLLRESLLLEGADPDVGRKLGALFAAAGLEAEIGIIASVWNAARYLQEIDDEWRLCTRGLGGLADEAHLRRLRVEDEAAARAGTRLAFLPVFYALARRP